LDDGREEKSPTGYGSQDQAVLLFRTVSLELRGAVQTRAEVLHDLAMFELAEVFTHFLFLIAISGATRFTMQTSSCRLVFTRKFRSPKNVFDPLANRILSHEREQNRRMLTPNYNFRVYNGDHAFAEWILTRFLYIVEIGPPNFQ